MSKLQQLANTLHAIESPPSKATNGGGGGSVANTSINEDEVLEVLQPFVLKDYEPLPPLAPGESPRSRSRASSLATAHTNNLNGSFTNNNAWVPPSLELQPVHSSPPASQRIMNDSRSQLLSSARRSVTPRGIAFPEEVEEELAKEKARREHLEASSEELMRASLKHHFELIKLRRMQEKGDEQDDEERRSRERSSSSPAAVVDVAARGESSAEQEPSHTAPTTTGAYNQVEAKHETELRHALEDIKALTVAVRRSAKSILGHNGLSEDALTDDELLALGDDTSSAHHQVKQLAPSIDTLRNVVSDFVTASWDAVHEAGSSQQCKTPEKQRSDDGTVTYQGTDLQAEDGQQHEMMDDTVTPTRVVTVMNEQEFADLQAEAEDLRSRLEFYQQLLGEEKAPLYSPVAEEELLAVQQELGETRAELFTVQRERETLRKQVTNSETKLAELTAKVDQLTKEKQQVVEELSNAKSNQRVHVLDDEMLAEGVEMCTMNGGFGGLWWWPRARRRSSSTCAASTLSRMGRLLYNRPESNEDSCVDNDEETESTASSCAVSRSTPGGGNTP